MKKLLLSVALGGTVLGLAGCTSKPAPTPTEGVTDQAMDEPMAASDTPTDSPSTSDAPDDGQGGGINRPPSN